jgi:hypothetical protein
MTLPFYTSLISAHRFASLCTLHLLRPASQTWLTAHHRRHCPTLRPLAAGRPRCALQIAEASRVYISFLLVLFRRYCAYPTRLRTRGMILKSCDLLAAVDVPELNYANTATTMYLAFATRLSGPRHAQSQARHNIEQHNTDRIIKVRNGWALVRQNTSLSLKQYSTQSVRLSHTPTVLGGQACQHQPHDAARGR